MLRNAARCFENVVLKKCRINYRFKKIATESSEEPPTFRLNRDEFPSIFKLQNTYLTKFSEG